VAVLLVAAKAGGALAERWRQPPVLGELLVGIALGNLLVPLLGAPEAQAVGHHPTLSFLAEIGVLILLFDVGLEADLRALARVGVSSVLVAVLGVVAPIALGWAAAAWLRPESPLLAHLFIGATLAATSVGITTRVLRDLGAMSSPEAQIILGAALLDDVLGLVVLAVVSGMAAAGGAAAPSPLTVLGILGRAALFLGVTIGLGRHLSSPIVRLAARTGRPESMLVFGLALCFALAYVAELLGLAPIVGAFAAGVMIDPYGTGVRTRAEDATLNELLHPISALFVPLFFILIGMQVRLGSLTEPAALALAAALIVAAVAGKLACALGVVSRGVDRLAVAIGMVPRGEVGLIFAGIGSTLRHDGEPLLTAEAFSAVVGMVLVTTVVAPVGLRWALGRARPTD
jgi:Kef-type K+ transport system membrane component KefB